MLSRLIAIGLILSLQLAPFATLTAGAGFALNRDYIIRALCVNRAKPQLGCKGKCYMKRMQKEAEKRKEASKDLVKEFQFAAFLPSHFLTICPSISLRAAYHFPRNIDDHQSGWPEATFRPPATCC